MLPTPMPATEPVTMMREGVWRVDLDVRRGVNLGVVSMSG